jgi:hypothetical protein
LYLFNRIEKPITETRNGHQGWKARRPGSWKAKKLEILFVLAPPSFIASELASLPALVFRVEII